MFLVVHEDFMQMVQADGSSVLSSGSRHSSRVSLNSSVYIL